MTPHIAEEMWHVLGHETLLSETAWPNADPVLVVDDSVKIAVQVNGKLRGTVELARDTGEEDARAAALALPAVTKLIAERNVRQVIVVPNRIINVVV